MPQVKIKGDPKYGVVSKVGSITLEYGVKGEELERELRQAQEKFIRDMGLRGLTLISGVPGNPRWTTDERGELSPFYAIDWEGKRKPRIGPDGEPLPRVRETSLEDSEGEVEYRIVGAFWAPEKMVEMIVDRQEILDAERARRHPTQFGYRSSRS